MDDVSLRVATTDLESIDAAFAWVIQKIDKYHFDSPVICISPYPAPNSDKPLFQATIACDMEVEVVGVVE